jgi:hypothetical protein
MKKFCVERLLGSDDKVQYFGVRLPGSPAYMGCHNDGVKVFLFWHNYSILFLLLLNYNDENE